MVVLHFCGIAAYIGMLFEFILSQLSKYQQGHERQ